MAEGFAEKITRPEESNWLYVIHLLSSASVYAKSITCPKQLVYTVFVVESGNVSTVLVAQVFGSSNVADSLVVYAYVYVPCPVPVESPAPAMVALLTWPEAL